MFVKLITAAVLLAHGIGHVMAPQAAFVPPGAFPRSAQMVATGMTITSFGGKALSLLWLLPLVGFLAGTYALWIGEPWWRPVLAASAVVSVAAVLPWWGVMQFSRTWEPSRSMPWYSWRCSRSGVTSS